MKKLRILLLLTLSASLFTVCNAQYTQLLNFNTTNGNQPRGSLILTSNVLYGMTYNGGTLNDGNVFSVHPDGTHPYSFYNFTGTTTNGLNPQGALTYTVGKKMYGMTFSGGTNNYGIIFSVDSGGQNFQDHWNFSAGPSTNGSNPYGSLIVSGRKLFGMTYSGGTNGLGNIFSIDTDGLNYKNLYSFSATSGDNPQGSLVLAGNMLYGMTATGGANGVGTIFSIDTNGNYYKDRWDFGGSPNNGANPQGSLTLVGKLLFGMTANGGINGDGNIFSVDTNANSNTYKDRWDFDNGGDTNGSSPYGDLTYSGKLFYGMTSNGGVNSSGNIFSIDTNGTRYKDVFDFNGANGTAPHGNVTLSGIVLYGMTPYGGANLQGVVFSDTLISVKTTDTNITCNGSSNGHGTANVTGGFSPFTYNWSGGHGTNRTATGLSAGIYTVTVTDNNGLVATTSVSITEPTAVAVTIASNTNNPCNGDITATATSNVALGGTSPYTYSWSGGHGTALTATGLTTGSYTITATDNHGCAATASVAITEPTLLTITTASSTGELCHGNSVGTVTANAANGGTTNYSYNWAPTGGTALTATGLFAGTYTITATDAHGCTATASIAVTQPATITAASSSTYDDGTGDGSAAIDPSGGTMPYTYSWAPGGQTKDSIAGLSSGSYTVTVTDNNGCSYSVRVLVYSDAGVNNITSASGQISIYPNPSNGIFTIQSSAVSGQSTVEVYNILGEAVLKKELTGQTTQINISTQPAGVYLYRVLSDNGDLRGQGKLIIQK